VDGSSDDAPAGARNRFGDLLLAGHRFVWDHVDIPRSSLVVLARTVPVV